MVVVTQTITITTNGDRIHVRCPFELKDLCKTIPGFRAHYEDGKFQAWTYPATPEGALSIHQALGTHRVLADQKYTGLLLNGHSARKAMLNKDADNLGPLPVKTPGGGWGHQRQAFHFARAQQASQLAMDMGTGKSLTAIALLEDWDAQMVLILGPRRALPVWPREFDRHALRDWAVIVPPLSAPVQKRAAAIEQGIRAAMVQHKPVAVCVNYESAWRPAMRQMLTDVAWDVMVMDESHRIKAPGGKASMFVSAMRTRAKRRVALTGTPMPHSPLDIYAQFRALDPGVFGTSFNRFRGRYAIMGGFEGRQVVGYQNEAELAEKMGTLSYVCKSDDVLDLPEYHHVEHYVDLEPKARQIYNRLDKEFIAGVGDGTITAANALVKLLRLQQLTGGWLRDDEDVLHRVSTAKEDLFKDWLADMPIHEPLAIFGRFSTDLAAVKEACQTAEGGPRTWGELSGKITERDPNYALAGADMREDIDVAVVQLQAGGVGIDLTRAAHAGYYSMGYSLGDYEQSLKRTHRHGQTRPVTYHHFICKGTKDESVYEALRERKNIVESMIEASRRRPL